MTENRLHKAQAKITAVFEFSQYGNLKGVFLNSETEDDQVILQKGLSQLLRPDKFGLIKKLFRWQT